MSIKIGNLDVSSFKVGSADCRVYLGDTCVYSGDTPTPHDYSQDYLAFRATESGTFKFSGNSISYSIDDGTTWTSLASDTNTPTVNAGDKILWKATGLTPTSNGIGKFSSTGNFEAEGNIMSLHFGDNFVNQTDLTGYNNAFRNLFKGCTTITSAENLILPATTLAQSCYQNMFQGCTNLTTALELPATTLAINCYSNMFSGCTALTTAPDLQATTLASNCYNSMFQNCTSLTTAPELPATTLVDNCYMGMFNGCTSLTTAPELPATTLKTYCYFNMFGGCTSLSAITCLATNISASNCTGSWVNGVAASGTFTKAASMANWSTSKNGIPSGWTVVDYSE